MVEQSNAAKISDETILIDTNAQQQAAEESSDQDATSDVTMSEMKFSPEKRPRSQEDHAAASLDMSDPRPMAKTQVEPYDFLLPEEEKREDSGDEGAFRGIYQPHLNKDCKPYVSWIVVARR